MKFENIKRQEIVWALMEGEEVVAALFPQRF
jgi:hypothetical protein